MRGTAVRRSAGLDELVRTSRGTEQQDQKRHDHERTRINKYLTKKTKNTRYIQHRLIKTG